jgi:bifunctional UDP-N-acetylglucosamine pyrophosphorylase/glucosamine-1-phosphate N-acetyltransferase
VEHRVNASTQQGKAPSRGLVAIVLAAGRSTRMKSDSPKVMHEICGRTMLAYVLDACRQAGIAEFYVVVGFGKEEVISAFGAEPGVHFVEQAEQKGTGHAVLMCKDALAKFTGDCVVIAGDMPMIRAETLQTLVGSHRATGAAASLATTILDDPTSYGRILRDDGGAFVGIVEHRDCTPEQLAIREVNPSYYCFDAKSLFEALDQIKPNNAKGEYYITDALAILRAAGRTVRASTKVPAQDAVGINSRADLAEVARHMQRRIQDSWMDAGVTIVDPANTWIDSDVQIGPETVIKPFCVLEGNARIGAGCTVGPFAYVAAGAVVGDGAKVGPGALTALDTVGSTRTTAGTPAKRTVQVVRRPPTHSSVAGGAS